MFAQHMPGALADAPGATADFHATAHASAEAQGLFASLVARARPRYYVAAQTDTAWEGVPFRYPDPQCAYLCRPMVLSHVAGTKKVRAHTHAVRGTRHART